MQCLTRAQPAAVLVQPPTTPSTHLQLQRGRQLLTHQRHRGATAARVFIKTSAASSSSSSSSRGSSQQGGGGKVAVTLTPTSFSSRKLQASVDIHAPLQVVWDALTDYENLGTFIPSLVENRCLQRQPHGCLLYQVGAQDVAMGIKFSAACTLEITEYPAGIPDHLCTTSGDMKRRFPSPLSTSSSSSSSGFGSSGSSSSSRFSSFFSSGSSGSSSAGSASANTTTSASPFSSYDDDADSAGSSAAAAAGGNSGGASSSSGVRDISFSLVEGDFQSFKGIWRMQPGGAEPASRTTLHYSLFVRPHPWLPVKLIEDRISSEVVNNLNAVRRHTERVHKQQMQQQQQQSSSSGARDG